MVRDGKKRMTNRFNTGILTNKDVIVMCGRYTVFTEEEIIEMNAIVAEVSRIFGSGAVNTGEIFPTNKALILTLEDERLTPVPVAWGFPRWGDNKGVIINARSESALQKTFFPSRF